MIAGNVRRTAEIAFGDPGSEEYIDLKNYEKNPERVGFGWASNNSVLAKLGMDYTKVSIPNEIAGMLQRIEQPRDRACAGIRATEMASVTEMILSAG